MTLGGKFADTIRNEHRLYQYPELMDDFNLSCVAIGLFVQRYSTQSYSPGSAPQGPKDCATYTEDRKAHLIYKGPGIKEASDHQLFSEVLTTLPEVTRLS